VTDADIPAACCSGINHGCANSNSIIASQVGEYDCLLLEHVFGNRPDDSVKVRTGAGVGWW
jgi:hypothetical protein